MLHPDLQKLLDYALQDGDLSEKEREILHKKAIELGQDIDVLEMVIEGELQKISKSKNDDKQKNQTCPNCGNSIPNSAIKCSFCGFEISKTSITGASFIEKLSLQLEGLNKLQATEEAADKWGVKGGMVAINYATKKASVISTFSMPNDKENLLEFFYFCDNNADATSNTNVFEGGLQAHVNKSLHPAWSGKAKMAYNKLSRFSNEDDEIMAINEKYKRKYHQEAEEMQKVYINKKQGNGKAVMMGLNLGGVITFFVLLLLCFPLCWLPFIMPQFKAE
jgi:hypothetical protein